jgi:hypothetical protein
MNMNEEKYKKAVSIVGGGKGGLELIKLLYGLDCVVILGVIDLNPDAVGIKEARRLGIDTFKDMTCLPNMNLDFVIEATRSSGVLEKIRGYVSPAVGVITSDMAHFLFVSASERQKRAVINIRDIQSNIRDSAHSISEVMKNNLNLIRELQIVAINASVEAAHSGDAGRGFSVVASRIRQLAETYRHNYDQINSINETIKEISQSVDTSLENLG